MNSAVRGRVGLAWAIIACLFLLTKAKAIAGLQFHDPDDELRLIQVRDLLAGQGWFDLHQYRIDAAHGGILMHWSRLVDAPIAAVILLLRPLMGQPAAEMAALLAIPALTLLCVLLLVGRMAARFLTGEQLLLACLAVGLSVPVMEQLQPLRVDHHGWQIVAALLAVSGFANTHARRGGWISGAALALWLSISMEGLPLTAALLAVMALGWLRDKAQWVRLEAAVQALALASVVLYLGTHGLADLVNHCDTISPVHLAVFIWGAAVLTAMRRHANKVPLILAVLAIAAAGGLAMALAVAPQCASGSFNEIDPVVRQYWFNSVAEGLPVWHQPPGQALQYILPPLVGLYAAIALARRSTGAARIWWADYALMLGAALLIAVMVSRAAAVAGALAALPLGWQLAQWLEAARRPATPAGRLAALLAAALAMVLALMPSLPAGLIQKAATGQDRISVASTTKVSSCRAGDATPVIARLPRGNILAPLDIGPRLLFETPHGVVATGHHRGAKAMRAVIDGFTGSADAAHAMMRQRGLAYLALCPDVAEPQLYRKVAPQGFAAQLMAGKTPHWLQAVPMPAGVGLKVWKRLD